MCRTGHLLLAAQTRLRSTVQKSASASRDMLHQPTAEGQQDTLCVPCALDTSSLLPRSDCAMQ